LVEKGKGIAEAIAAHHDLVLCILSRTVDAVIDLVMEEEPLVTALQASLRSVLVPFLNNVMVRYKANLTEVFDFLTAFGVLSSADYQFPIMKYVQSIILTFLISIFYTDPAILKEIPTRTNLLKQC
jgi:hypothetical protein